MTGKDKRQLRAEAVERLKGLRNRYPLFDSDIGAAIADGDIDNAINLLADDEPPEGDPVRIMRECAAPELGMEGLRKMLGFELVAGWPGRCLRKLADMVERDYVRREVYDKLLAENADDAEAINRLAAERDEWKARAEHDGVERSDGGARRGMTNLEWLYGSDEFFNRFARWYVTDGGKADDDIQADEWLMAELGIDVERGA